MKANVNKNLCIGCQACISVCPTKAIELTSDNKVKIIESKCIGCQACISVCPVNALNMVDK